jgi:thioesterase domain-containing protein
LAIVDVGDFFTQAQAQYRLQTLDGNVTLFRSRDRGEDGFVPHDLGWGPYVGGEVSVWDVPGGHHSMCLEPNVNVLATHLSAAIAAASRQPATVAAGVMR